MIGKKYKHKNYVLREKRMLITLSESLKKYWLKEIDRGFFKDIW